eukprot:1902185-Rhodomonas_salina.1
MQQQPAERQGTLPPVLLVDTGAVEKGGYPDTLLTILHLRFGRVRQTECGVVGFWDLCFVLSRFLLSHPL